MNGHSPEAVSAALTFVDNADSREKSAESANALRPYRIAYEGRLSETAARILATEVRRLRDGISTIREAMVNNPKNAADTEEYIAALKLTDELTPPAK